MWRKKILSEKIFWEEERDRARLLHDPVELFAWSLEDLSVHEV